MEAPLKFVPVGLVLLVVAMQVLGAQKNVSERPRPGDRPAGNPQSTRSVVMGRHGMIATSQPLASAAGLKVLQDGGNAIDAAVAAAAVLAVVEPTMTGIGGDLFAIVYDARTKRLRGLNASGRSGYASTPEGFSERGLPAVPGNGVHSVTVPGVVDGWTTLLSAYGTVPLSRLLTPAIDYAKNGYAVPEIISDDWQASEGKLSADPAAARTFLPGGHAPRPGEIFANPNLAATLQQIASGGRDEFYKGRVAAAIVADLKRRQSFLDARDFAEHKSDWVEPISVNYRGYDVYEMPPNTQGFLVLEMLNILEGFDIKSLGHNSPEYLHLLVEAKRIAFADRAAWLADAEFVPPALLKTLISKEYATSRRKEIDPAQAAQTYAPAAPGRSGASVSPAPRNLANKAWSEQEENLTGQDRGDTIYLTVADNQGNFVSLIQSLYSDFGSGIVAGDTGVVLHNRGALFTLRPGHPNQIGPHKRPLHTLIPAFVMKDGKPWLSFGVMGGDHQAQGHTQVLVNLIDFGMNIQEAGEAARVNHGVGGVMVESAVPQAVRDGLMQRGHPVSEVIGAYGGFQGIVVDPRSGVLMGGSDPRKDGLAIGF
jgi:gamma-glutamyltranspeptidase/glutathione hydrolase